MNLFTRLASFALLVSLLFAIACQQESSSSGNISADAFLEAPPENVLVLDVRSPGEFTNGHIADAVNIPHDELASRLSELPGGSDRPVVVYCESGVRAARAEAVLADAGYSNILHLEGDMRDWRAKGRPIE